MSDGNDGFSAAADASDHLDDGGGAAGRASCGLMSRQDETDREASRQCEAGDCAEGQPLRNQVFCFTIHGEQFVVDSRYDKYMGSAFGARLQVPLDGPDDRILQFIDSPRRMCHQIIGRRMPAARQTAECHGIVLQSREECDSFPALRVAIRMIGDLGGSFGTELPLDVLDEQKTCFPVIHLASFPNPREDVARRSSMFNTVFKRSEELRLSNRDHELEQIADYRRGDPRTMALVERWQRAAVTSAGALEPDDMADVIQTAQIQLWRYVSRDDFRPRGSFRSLAVRIALARRIDVIRRRRFLVELDRQIPDGDDSTLDHIELRERASILHDAITRMRTLCKILIRGRFLEGKTYDDLADETGKRPTTLRVHLHRCLQVLRETVEGLYT